MRNLYILLSLFFLISSCATSPETVENKHFPMHPLSIVQGTTNAHETYISIVSPQKIEGITYTWSKVEEDPDVYKNTKEMQEAPQVKVQPLKTWTSPKNKYRVEHIHIKNIKPQTLYKITARLEEEVIDERTFKSLNLSNKNARIGVASCMDDRFFEESKKMWSSYMNKFLDVNFFIGDNVYADNKNGEHIEKSKPLDLWRRYYETFKKVYFYHSSHLTPTVALWDDHDYGKNDGGKNYSFKEESLDIFRTFYPYYNMEGYKKTDLGAGSRLQAFGQNFLFLDGRYYREKNKKGAHLGEKQIQYVMKDLKTKRPVWLIKGDQFFGGYHPFESYEGDHPNEFKSFLKRVQASKAKPVIFVSGDRHLTEIMEIPKKEIGHKTYEITSSAIHAKVFKNAFKKHPNPRQLIGKDGVFNYTVIEIRDQKDYEVTSFGEKNWNHYKRALKF